MVKTRLLTPGPTQVPERALALTTDALLHPRSEEFSVLLRDVSHKLKAFFKTEHDVLTLTASGTGAMDAAVVNFARHGDKVITIDGGKFGERWGELGRTYGLQVVSLPVPWGQTAEPQALAELLRKHPDAVAVFLTHSETSTGAAFDVESLAAAVRQESDALAIVDAISSAGVMPLYMDRWGIDVCVSGSQKGAMAPPGLAFVAVGARAWERAERGNLPRYYLDLRRARDGLAEGYAAWTPAVTLIAGLRASLDMILSHGLERSWERYARLARAARAAVQAVDLRLFAQTPSNAVTAASIPEAIDGRRLIERLYADHGVRVAGGQDRLKGKIFRVAHMGYCDYLDLVGFAAALELALRDCGWPVTLGASLGAMQVAYGHYIES